MFIVDSYYSRKEAWAILNPGKLFPKGGNWATGYVTHESSLLIFANIDAPGRTGHDFPNEYNYDSKTMLWFGKPNAHSQQPTFKKLFDGTLAPHVFVRWDNKNTSFLYLGRPSISSFKDGIKIKDSLETIKVVFEWNKGISNPPPEGIINGESEGNHSFTITNRYERNPALRAACIEYFGVICQVCGFNFESAYGSLGKDYCHVHHITPLSQMGGSHHVNPLTDLIPLCANCHAMIHRGSTVLLPEDLKRVVNKHT